MGTRGYYVFKYKGIYYIFYNHYDSYFDNKNGLGYKIIEELIKYINEGNIKYILEQMKQLIKNINIDVLDQEISDGSSLYPNDILKPLIKPDDYIYHISKKEPNIDLSIEYIYIIDLDLELFRMKSNYFNSCNLKLLNIPENWLYIFIND
jgi:hypothetical protein